MAISTREWTAALAERVGDLQSALAFATRLPVPSRPCRGRRWSGRSGCCRWPGRSSGRSPRWSMSGHCNRASADSWRRSWRWPFQAWITGALHEDGLADFADGIGGGNSRERKLAIMRDSRVGSIRRAGAPVRGARARCWRWGRPERCPDAVRRRGIDHRRHAVAAGAGAAASIGCRRRGSRDCRTASDAPTRRRRARRPSTLWPSPACSASRSAGPERCSSSCLPRRRLLGIEAVSRRQLGGQTGDAAGAAQQLVELAVLLAFAAGNP